MRHILRVQMARLAGIGLLAAAAGVQAQAMPPAAGNAASAAGAADWQAPRPAPAEAPAGADGLPAAQQVDGVRYVTGGFGQTESTALRNAMPDYRLGIVFSQASGAYVADVPVRVEGQDGAPSVSVTAKGPYLLIDLPAGKYRVHATHEGREMTRDVQVGSQAQRIGFAW